VIRLSINSSAKARLAKTQVSGFITVIIEYVPIATKVIACLRTLITYEDRVSEYGFFQDLRIVGTKAKRAVSVAMIDESRGCLTISHRKNDIIAIAKNHLSDASVFFALVLKPKSNTNNVKRRLGN